jgi:hypothetical protein
MRIKPKTIMTRKLAYFEDRGSELQSFSLLMAVYYDDFERAKATLMSDPEQLNIPDPFAGLTALHIAIFRQNVDITRLLLSQPGTDVRYKDTFGRQPVDMLRYTVNQKIFGVVMDATYPDEMRALEDEACEEGLTKQTVVPFKLKGP